MNLVASAIHNGTNRAGAPPRIPLVVPGEVGGGQPGYATTLEETDTPRDTDNHSRGGYLPRVGYQRSRSRDGGDHRRGRRSSRSRNRRSRSRSRNRRSRSRQRSHRTRSRSRKRRRYLCAVCSLVLSRKMYTRRSTSAGSNSSTNSKKTNDTARSGSPQGTARMENSSSGKQEKRDGKNRDRQRRRSRSIRRSRSRQNDNRRDKRGEVARQLAAEMPLRGPSTPQPPHPSAPPA